MRDRRLKAAEERQPPTRYSVDGPAPLPPTVRRKSAADAEAAAAPLRRAVFIAHGMGQQIVFQTLDAVAERLFALDETRRTHLGLPPADKPPARRVGVGQERLSRIELALVSPTGDARQVHLYEGYWAPLTEGKVGLRDVFGFLVRATLNGLKHAGKPFDRWLFQRYRWFRIPVVTPLALIWALLVALALAVINAVIAAAAVARSPLRTPPPWLSGSLFADLTTTLNALLLVVLTAGFAVLATSWLGRRVASKVRQFLASLTWITVLCAIVATVVAGCLVPLLVYAHVRRAEALPAHVETSELWAELFEPARLEAFNRCAENLLLWGVLLVAAVLFVGRIVTRLPHFGEWGSLVLAATVLSLFAAIVAGIWALSGLWLLNLPAGQIARRGVAWPLLIVVSAQIRNKLIQFLGDVAAYVTPHTLDRFNELRDEVRETVRRSAWAVYAKQHEGSDDREYDAVVVVGHSLGSVVVYDVLNRLINEDELHKRRAAACKAPLPDEWLDVLGRTRLLITFGSPLDKTAYLFALQGQATSETREALAATTQPLIAHRDYRTFPWINVFSPHDVIGGPLEYYDTPAPTDPDGPPLRVDNRSDPGATTPLLAHVEHWQSNVVFDAIYHAVT